MQLISLFSGIGGFELAAEWAKWDVVVSCEINPFGQKVLNYYWPDAYHHGDIHTLNYETIKKESRYDESRATVLVGGFPCQPFSVAGKRKGTEDDRHLWPQMLRVIREVRPRWVVGENVYGLINWDGGLVFDQVHTDLEREGYEVRAYVLPACGVNAPHRRYRVWFVGKRIAAHPGLQRQTKRQEQPMGIDELCEERIITNSNVAGEWWNEWKSKSKGNLWEQFPTQSPICSGDDGLSDRLAGITFPKWRNEGIKAMGNAVVPQVVYQIFKAINEYEKHFKH